MAEDFLIETRNENGIVEQQRVSVDETVLWLTNRGLVPTVQQLYVRTHFPVSNLTHSRLFYSAEQQPLCRRASVRTQLVQLDVSLVLRPLFVVVVAHLSAALPEPLVVSPLSDRSHDGVERPLRENCHRVRSCLIGHRLLAVWQSPLSVSTSITRGATCLTCPCDCSCADADVAASARLCFCFSVRIERICRASVGHIDADVAPISSSGYVEPTPAQAEMVSVEGARLRSSVTVPPQTWSIDASELELGTVLGEGAFGVVRSGKWRRRTVAVTQIADQKVDDRRRQGAGRR
jgi:hypothetical protein